MAKRYTSSHVREAIRNAICDVYVVNVLKQFAEDLEREEGLRKRFTAQDVRAVIQTSVCDAKTIKVLMRYEKYLERKNSCGTKYEYAEKTCDGFVDSIHEESFQKASHAKFFGDSTIVRRSVGEWEEVSND